MFDETKLYPANDPAVTAIAPYMTMAHWRCEGRGPAYLKIGGRVLYRGDDLNHWLESRRIEPVVA